MTFDQYIKDVSRAGTILEIRRILSDAERDDKVNELQYGAICMIAEEEIEKWNL